MSHEVIAVLVFVLLGMPVIFILFTGTGNQIMGLGGPQGGGMVQPSSIPASSCKLTFKFCG